MLDSKSRVLYIASAPHSGTTAMERFLAQDQRYVATGEIHRLSFRGAERSCACGALLPDCLFWSAAVSRVSGADPARFYDSKSISVGPKPSIRSRLALLGHLWRNKPTSIGTESWRLFDVLLEMQRAHVVIDGTKNIARLLHLSVGREATSEMVVLHVVRDARGIYHSAERRESGTGNAAVRQWVFCNLALMVVSKVARIETYTVVKYEDFAEYPDQFKGRVDLLSHLDVEQVSSESIERHHQIPGNSIASLPLISIRHDQSWQAAHSTTREPKLSLAARRLNSYFGYRS